jgi:hypothetical protein
MFCICSQVNVGFWHIVSFCGDAPCGRFRREADMNWQARPAASVENDPKRTSVGREILHCTSRDVTLAMQYAA